ncbi:MAG: lamin tail domain-containing protein [Candidatus Hadarchaeota archaeon]
MSPIVEFSSSANSISIAIGESKWIINPGGTFTVYVAVVNNENTAMENVQVYAYVFDGSNVLNVGGWQSNKVTINLAPNENRGLELQITIKDNALPGVYNLRARVRMPDDTTYDDTENIYVENTGVRFKIGPTQKVDFAGSWAHISATAANLTPDNIENFYVFIRLHNGELVVNENWGKVDNILSGEIKSLSFDLKINENADYGDYELKIGLKLPDNTYVTDERPIKLVSLIGIKRKINVLENGIMPQTENFLNLYYVGRGRDNLIKINEVHANVVGQDEGNEWIEIYNTSQENLGWAGVRIANWKIVDNEGTLATVPLGVILQPDDYYVFEGLSGLNNAGDNIRLVNDKGEVIDHLGYTSTVEGKSIARLPNASDNWVDNAQPTEGRNNSDNSEGEAYLPKINLADIKSVALRLKVLLEENAEELVLTNAEIYDAIRYINQYGTGITEQEAAGVVRYVQTYGKLQDNYRNMLLSTGLSENDILGIENFIKENSNIVINAVPSLGLEQFRQEYTKTTRALIDTAAASLHIAVAADIEHQIQNLGFSGGQYISELQSRWNTTSSDLAVANTYDSTLYEAMKIENWQRAYDNADALMDFSENRSLEIVDEIHLARAARLYFRENGTSDNVKLVADYEWKFTKALDRFLYSYQKGLYFKMTMLAALNGDNEQALSEAANAKSMPLTVNVGEQVWQPLKNAPGIANMATEVAQSNGVWYVYVARLYQHHLDRYRIDTNGWTTTSSLSENAWGWDAGVSLEYAENGGSGYLYALMGGDTREFWRYNLANNSWENLGFTPNFVSAGGSLVWTGGNVLYATRGKSSTEFWLYHIENNSWDNATLAPVPGDLETGAGLAWDNGNYLYTFKGGGATNFYRYSISGNSWVPVTAAPDSIGAGASLELVASSIYATRGGGTTNFWRYNTSNNTWENATSTLATVGTRAGDRLVKHGDYLYLPRGENDNQFWRFKLEERWVTVEELLANPSNYDNKEVWIKGFMSNVQRKQTQDNVPYSLFDITTNEGAGAGVDNTRYSQSENINVFDGELKLTNVSAGNHVVISEVYPDPVVAYDRAEFVELYNPTSSDISLAGYSLWEENINKINFATPHVIKAHSYFLITDDDYPAYKNQENASWPDPDVTVAWALSNSGDGVVLRDPNGNIVDRFGYATTSYYEGSPFPSTPAQGKSAERYSSAARSSTEDRGNAFDTDNNAYDFFVQSAPKPENSKYTEHPPTGGYRLGGYLESAIYDAGVSANWKNILWTENKPAGTNVIVEIRTGNSSKIDNTWSAWENVVNGQDINKNSRFAQYRVRLSTTNDNITPSLQELRINYAVSGQARAWVQSDWFGGGGMESWSAQQRLRVYFVPHIDVSQGAGENSYGIFRGVFNASHWLTGAPQLNMLGVKLFTNGEPVSIDTPTSWTTYTPWGAAGYVGSSSITRSWGWAVFFDSTTKGIREGALFAAFTTLEDAFGEYTAFLDLLWGAITTVVGGIVTFAGYLVSFIAPPIGIGMMTWGVETMWEGAVEMAAGAISLAAEVVVDVVGDAIASAKEAQHYEAEYNWAWEMNYDRDGPEGPDGDYGWEDSGWEWEGPEGDDGGGMDGADFGC